MPLFADTSLNTSHRPQSSAGIALASFALLVAIGCTNQPDISSASAESAGEAANGAGRTLSGKAPAGAIVILESREPQEFPAPTEAAVMDQAGQQFYPGLLLARTGQPVQFLNSEDVLHNVRVHNSGTGEAVFNISTPPFKAYTYTFEKPGYYAVSCDVHPAMSASILVTATPYAAVAGRDGTFALTGVKPGSYGLTAYITGRRVERIVEITDATTELVVDRE